MTQCLQGFKSLSPHNARVAEFGLMRQAAKGRNLSGTILEKLSPNRNLMNVARGSIGSNPVPGVYIHNADVPKQSNGVGCTPTIHWCKSNRQLKNGNRKKLSQ